MERPLIERYSFADEFTQEPDDSDRDRGIWIRDRSALSIRHQYVYHSPLSIHLRLPSSPLVLLFLILSSPTCSPANPSLPAVDPETRAEFEEQQKKSILNTSAAGGNPLQNFDMAAWMAGKTSGAGASSGSNSSGGREGDGGKSRRRG